jgi:glutathione peroxidase
MKAFLLVAVAMVFASAACNAEDKPKGDPKVTSPLDFKVSGIDGKEVDLSKYKGKVVLFVNVASQCGYTKQYTGLQAIYKKYEKDGFVIVGVPANNFGSQEPGTNEEIVEFCSSKYSVTFPMLAKVSVKGDDKSPLYSFLTSKETNPKFAGEIGWNFEKFLINKKGEVVGKFKSGVAPDSDELTKAIKAELDAK